MRPSRWGRLLGGLYLLLLLTAAVSAQEARVWKAGLTTTQLEEKLAHAKVVKMESMQSVLGEAWQGSSDVYLLDLEGGLQAVFRSEDEPRASRAELGGYHFDRWLGTELVPPTVERTLHKAKGLHWPWKSAQRSGSIQYFVPSGPDPSADDPRLADGEVLGFVLGRYDNHSGNLISDHQGRPALIDFESSLDLQQVRYGDFPFVRRGGKHADPRSVSAREPFPFDNTMQLTDPDLSEIELVFGPWWGQVWPEGMEGLYHLLDGIPGRIVPYVLWDDRLWVQVRVRSRHPAFTTSYTPAVLQRLAQLDEATLRTLLPEPFGEAQFHDILNRRDQLLQAARSAP